MLEFRIAAPVNPATRSQIEKHEGDGPNNRWMVWAPDKNEPECVSIGHCCPTIQQMDFAVRLGRLLNKWANEGGTWLVAWTEPGLSGVPTRLAFGWIDKDRDMPFTVDTEEAMQVLTTAGIDHYAKQGHDAWVAYQEHIKQLDLAPNQMKKLAMGEPVADPSVLVPADAG